MSGFALFLFSTDAELIQRVVGGGAAGVIVDWERVGKRERRDGRDTQIGVDTLEDLRRLRDGTRARVLCRINGYGPWTTDEVAQAVDGGADEILLPMVRGPAEVERVLGHARGQCEVGILVETVAALAEAAALAALPLSRVYVGLNDLAIERGSACIFEALADGTVESLRRHFAQPFGFGGLTVPERGEPIPCRLLMAELARLRCDYTFLRRSFLRDVHGRDAQAELARMLGAMEQTRHRRPAQVHSEHEELLRAIARWSGREQNAGA